MEDVRRRPRAAAWWLGALAYAAVIFYFSSRPAIGLPRWWFMRYDKVLHAGEYFWLGALVAVALRASGLGLGRACVLAVVVALGYAVTDEYHQTFVPGRSGNDLGDLTADAVGATLGAGALGLYARRRARAA